MDLEDVFAGVEAPCCIDNDGPHCAVPEKERVLHAYAKGFAPLPPMSVAQRLWCYSQLTGDSTTIGRDLIDAELAAAVLTAWNQ